MQRRVADVVIGGGGVIGCSIAMHLGRRGTKVTVVEPNDGVGQGTTSYSSSIVRVFYSVPESVQCAWESYHCWLQWRDYVGIPKSEVVPTFRHHDGFLIRSPRSAQFVDRFVDIAGRYKIPVVELNKEETQARAALAGWDVSRSYKPKQLSDPTFDTPENDEGITSSVIVPTTGYISDPRLATQNFMAAAKATGNVEFVLGRSVTGATKRGNRIDRVLLDNGDSIETRMLVNAAGPYSSLFNKAIFDDAHPNDSNVTTRALRAEVAVLDAPPGIDLDKHGVMAPEFDVGIYVRPEFGNRLVVGSLDADCDELVFEDTPWKQNTAFTDMWDHNVYRAALRMPTLQIPSGRLARGVTSMYDFTSDWTPLVDKTSIDGYFMAIGTNGNCFKKAPVLGEAMANLIQYVADGNDHDKKPLQMKLERRGLSMDLSQFSRLRKLHNALGGVFG